MHKGSEVTLSATSTGKIARLTKQMNALSCAYANGKGVSTTLRAFRYQRLPSEKTCEEHGSPGRSRRGHA